MGFLWYLTIRIGGALATIAVGSFLVTFGGTAAAGDALSSLTTA